MRMLRTTPSASVSSATYRMPRGASVAPCPTPARGAGSGCAAAAARSARSPRSPRRSPGAPRCRVRTPTRPGSGAAKRSRERCARRRRRWAKADRRSAVTRASGPTRYEPPPRAQPACSAVECGTWTSSKARVELVRRHVEARARRRCVPRSSGTRPGGGARPARRPGAGAAPAGSRTSAAAPRPRRARAAARRRARASSARVGMRWKPPIRTPTGFTERPPSRIRMRLPSLRSRSARSTSGAVQARDLHARRRGRGSPAPPGTSCAAGGSRSTRRRSRAGAAHGPGGCELDAPGRLDRVDGAHLVRDRADAADARHQIGQLVGAAAAREGLEEARRLVDLEAQVDDAIALDAPGAARLRPRRARARRPRCVRRSVIAPASSASASVAELTAPAVDAAQAPQRRRARDRPDASKLAAPATPDSGRRRARSSRSSRGPCAGQIAPQPARVTGPMQGTPRATSTQIVAAALALDAHARDRQVRRRAEQQPRQHAQHLLAVHRAAVDLVVDLHVVGDRRRGRERLDPLRVRIDVPLPALDVGAVAQRLDAAAGRAGADRDQQLRLLADLGGCARRRARVVMLPSTSATS